MHRSGKAANDPAIEVVQAVGYIKIDLDTPTPVLREFIRRFCGGWLNEHAKVYVDKKLTLSHTAEPLPQCPTARYAYIGGCDRDQTSHRSSLFVGDIGCSESTWPPTLIESACCRKLCPKMKGSTCHLPPFSCAGHQGDRFLMENANGGLVRRSMEGGKLVATAMDMVQERVNKSSRDTEAVVFVQDERSRAVSVEVGR